MIKFNSLVLLIVLAMSSHVTCHKNDTDIESDVNEIGNDQDEFIMNRLISLTNVSLADQWQEIQSLRSEIKNIKNRMKNKQQQNLADDTMKEVLLAIGGHNGKQRMASVEMYDPDTGRWRYVSSMPHARAGHSSVVIDNAVYTCGGFDGDETFNSCIRYDPIADAWDAGVADMFHRRRGHGAALVNGRILVVGGYTGNNYLNSVESYNPHNNTWTKVENHPEAKYMAGVASLNGSLYVAGGADKNGRYNTLHRYDDDTDSWTNLTNMNENRYDLSLIPVQSNDNELFLYAIGGSIGNVITNTVERYHVEQDTGGRWENVDSSRIGNIFRLNIKRENAAAVMADAEMIHICGGIGGKNASTCERLNVTSNYEGWKYSDRWSMNTPRFYHTLVTVKIPRK